MTHAMDGWREQLENAAPGTSHIGRLILFPASADESADGRLPDATVANSTLLTIAHGCAGGSTTSIQGHNRASEQARPGDKRRGGREGEGGFVQEVLSRTDRAVVREIVGRKRGRGRAAREVSSRKYSAKSIVL